MGDPNSSAINTPLLLEISRLLTERASDEFPDFQQISNEEILTIITDEYAQIINNLKPIQPVISRLIDDMVSAIQSGGSVIYCGAGTSGRLGVLDASEIPPTFGASTTIFRGIIAGGETALRQSIEGAEDDVAQAITDYKLNTIKPSDILIGISASSRTPYVLSMIEHHHQSGGKTGLIVCNPKTDSDYPAVTHLIPIVAGNEFITGSTRMKSGTLTKIILNNLSTITMIRLGKTYKNYMVDLRVVNEKLRVRAVKTIMELTGLTADESHYLLVQSGLHVKTALVMHLTGMDFSKASDTVQKNPLILHELHKTH